MPVEACSGLWRSEDMMYLSLQMQREVAHDAVLKLGEIGQFQFQDLNVDVSAFQRDFVQEVRRCDDMDRKLRYLHEEIQRAGVMAAVASDANEDAEVTLEGSNTMTRGSNNSTNNNGGSIDYQTSGPETMFSLEQKIDERYNEVMELNEQYQALMGERNRTKEHLEVLHRVFGSDSDSDGDENARDATDNEEASNVNDSHDDDNDSLGDTDATERDRLNRPSRAGEPSGHNQNKRNNNTIVVGGGRSSNDANYHSTSVMLRGGEDRGDAARSSSSLNEGLMILTGVLPRDRVDTFERVVFRASRGNFLIRCDDIRTPFYSPPSHEKVFKTVFVLYFSAPRLRGKLQKLCEVNGGTLYRCPDGPNSARAMRQSLRQQLAAVTHTLQQSARQHCRVLSSMASACDRWRRIVATEGAVFATMNKLRFAGSTAVAQGWAPVRGYEDICAAIAEAEYSSGAQASTIIESIPHTIKTPNPTHNNSDTVSNSIDNDGMSGNTDAAAAVAAASSVTQSHVLTPPTYFKTNKYTESFQSIVNSYGMARYKEVNPGVFTIITFPYLFGVMYGDIGHGLLLTALAVYLVCRERTLEQQRASLPEMVNMIFGGRYLLLLMGLFAVYMGLLYNDMFGFSLELFRSGYLWPELPPAGPAGVVYPIDPSGTNPQRIRTPQRTVVFGIDSAWTETENKLEFYNSIKMKCSVIIGVVQMLVGVCMSWCNYRYFHEELQVWFRFVPEVVFLSCTFGYMCVLIVLKWCLRWELTYEAPSLLETMTNFFLAPGTVSRPLYRGQAAVQVLLLLVAACCVPCMLCVIPYLEKKRHDAAVRARREERITSARYRTHVDTHSLGNNSPTATTTIIINNNNDNSDGGSNNASSTHHHSNPNNSSHIRDSGGDVTDEMSALNNSTSALLPHYGLSMNNSSSSKGEQGNAIPPRSSYPGGDIYHAEDDGDEAEAEDTFDLSEIIIHQMIHTIEYVLGCVSNTASYLRLWALSLAHSQLSEVFWNFAFLLMVDLDGGSGVFVFIGFAVWMLATLGVLLGMESLSAFLHALRLHWVEFNNKFYSADGHAFEPFDLADTLNKL